VTWRVTATSLNATEACFETAVGRAKRALSLEESANRYVVALNHITFSQALPKPTHPCT